MLKLSNNNLLSLKPIKMALKGEAVDLCFVAKILELVAKIGNSPNGRLIANINASIIEFAIVTKPISSPLVPPKRMIPL